MIHYLNDKKIKQAKNFKIQEIVTFFSLKRNKKNNFNNNINNRRHHNIHSSSNNHSYNYNNSNNQTVRRDETSRREIEKTRNLIFIFLRRNEI